MALGEDDPTHQPIEHLTTLRATPNVHTWRPANLLETAIAWQSSVKRKDGPSSLILSRQNLNYFNNPNISEICLGGYFVEKRDEPKINLIATGSEVATAIAAAEPYEGRYFMQCCKRPLY